MTRISLIPDVFGNAVEPAVSPPWPEAASGGHLRIGFVREDV